ncbi:MAG TPA: carbohydrate kinase, partial [Ktedonobacteraceae bacterium]|nr:carbohydrate kinase [Ktedonobacteraceae bacterium]
MNGRQFDVVAAGEILVDLISDDAQSDLVGSSSFTMYPGGSVANVALNVASLGGAAALFARVGSDAFGTFLQQRVQDARVDTSLLSSSSHSPTTAVVVTRQQQRPDFIAYRGADIELESAAFPAALLADARWLHTSAFALSYEPARSTLLRVIAQARSAGCYISFDPNYHPRIWERDVDPFPFISSVCSYSTLVKPSLDDCTRLFGPGASPEAYAAHFRAWGAEQVLLTMGQKGVLLVNAAGHMYFPAQKVNVVDVTGAGDAFLAGVLLARRDGLSYPDAVRFAQAVAAMKLQQLGPLHHQIDRFEMYDSLGLQGYEIASPENL